MRRLTDRMLPLFLILCLYAVSFDSALADTSSRPNVLMICIDDLNDWVGCLKGHPDAHTPNIDRLARRGVLFTNAHCQAPICNPSRTSFMLGLRPSSTGIYMNSPWFRTTARNKDHVTLTQHFATQGYRTFTTGKIYHGSRLDGPSFQVVGPRPGQMNPLARRIQTELTGLWDFGPQGFEEEKFHDFVDASWAIDQLGKTQEKPFFLTIGFYRPHVPFYYPKRLSASMPLESIDLPEVIDGDRDDLPEIATQITANGTPPSQEWFLEDGRWRDAVRAYLACTRFTDEQIGRLLDALDESDHAENTIIVLLSDHGFHLGEKERWAKQSLWERSTRVPFVIVVPEGLHGVECSKPVELLSIYPTLIDLCDVERRPQLEGTSLVTLLEDPEADWTRPAITTYGQNNHAVRTERWRYIRYYDGSEELYDHAADTREWINLAADPKFDKVKRELAAWLPKVNVTDLRSRKVQAGKRKK